MLKAAALAALCLILAIPAPGLSAGRNTGSELRQLDLTLLPRLLESYADSRRPAKQALALYEEKGLAGILAEAERDLDTASLPATRISAIAHEWHAANAWFLGVLALVKNEPAPGKPLAASAGLPASRAGAFFRLTEEDRARLFTLTQNVFATAEQRLAEEKEHSRVFMLRYGAGGKTIRLLERGSGSCAITVSASSGDAAILLEGCREGSYCFVTYTSDGDDDFKRVKTARHARKSD